MEARKFSLPLLIILLIAAALIGGFFALILNETAVGEWLPLASDTKSEETTVTETDDGNDAENAAVAAEKIIPSVVGIVATNSSSVYDGTDTAVTESTGSGIIIDERGYIVTNYHVIAETDLIRAVFSDNSETEATVVGHDKRTDLALLKVEKEGLTAAVFAENDALEVGQTALAVGNPGGLDFAGTVTKGIISGLNRYIVTDDGISFHLIQTDAAINPGNSGGALCNEKGEVIGVNTIKITESGFEGMGFAIPAATVKEIVAEILQSGSVNRGAMGVYLLFTLDENIAKAYNTGIDYGVMITLQEDGAAEQAGLKDYDIITKFNGNDVTDMYDLQDKVFSCDAGDTVSVTVYREGSFLDYQIVLGELKE